MVINFLAPDSPDRYFEFQKQRYPLRWAAAVPAAELQLVDDWQRVSVNFHAPKAQKFWISPIETISESEDGFERIYQGSQIMAVCPIDLASGPGWTGNLLLEITHLPNRA